MTKREKLREELTAGPEWFGCPNCSYGPCGCDEGNKSISRHFRGLAVDLLAVTVQGKLDAHTEADLALVKRWI